MPIAFASISVVELVPIIENLSVVARLPLPPRIASYLTAGLAIAASHIVAQQMDLFQTPDV